MPDPTSSLQRWQVSLTFRLVGSSNQIDSNTIREIEASLRQHPSVASAYAGLESSVHSLGITATIALVQPSTPGTAVDQATTLLATACATAGVKIDVIKEIAAELADIDPRSL